MRAKNLAYAQDEIIRTLYGFAKENIPEGIHQRTAGSRRYFFPRYGRGTLARRLRHPPPLSAARQAGRGERQLIEFILYTLWDMRLKVGHATRSTEECIRLAKTDNTILTSILEARFICGNERLSKSMQFHFRRDIVQAGARKFVADKLAERDIRLAKSGRPAFGSGWA